MFPGSELPVLCFVCVDFALHSARSKHSRRQICKGIVWPQMVVVHTPFFKLFPRVLDAPKQVRVQALIPQPSVEAFDEPVIHRLAGAYEVKFHSVLIGPCVQSPAAKLRAILHGDGLRDAALLNKSSQAGCDLL